MVTLMTLAVSGYSNSSSTRRTVPPLVLTRVRCGLVHRLIGTGPGLLIDLGSGVPEHDLVGDVPLDGVAVLEKGDTHRTGGEEQVVGLDQHCGKRQVAALPGLQLEHIAVSRTHSIPWPQGPRHIAAIRRIEHSSVNCLGQGTGIAVFSQGFEALSAVRFTLGEQRLSVAVDDEYARGKMIRRFFGGDMFPSGPEGFS